MIERVIGGLMRVLTGVVRSAKKQTTLLWGIAVGLVVGIGSAVALASIPDGNSVIHACYRSSGLLANGQVRIIDSATQTCDNNETATTWDQTGPQGPAGLPGSDEFGSLLPLTEAADLYSLDLRYRNLKNGDFTDTNFAGVKLSWSDLNDSNFNGANLDTIGEHINFSNGSFTNANMETGGRLTSSNFSNANMSNLHISSMWFNDSNFAGTNFTNTHFDNVILTGANMATAVLTGATWTAAICPDGTNSDANGNTCVGHLTP